MRDRGEELSRTVVGFDLGGQGVPGETQAFDKVLTHDGPVNSRLRHYVSGESPCCSGELRQIGGLDDAISHPRQAARKHREFFSKSGGCGGLSVSFGQHGGVAPGPSEFGDTGGYAVERRQPHLSHSVAGD